MRENSIILLTGDIWIKEIEFNARKALKDEENMKLKLVGSSLRKKIKTLKRHTTMSIFS